jgi:hypothetical protein
MISRYDFSDALHLLFETRDACIETPLDRMKSSTFFFDSRKLVYYFYRCANFLAVVSNLQTLKAKLDSFEIGLSVIFSGIDVLDPAPLLNPAFMFSRFLEKYYYFRMIYKIISENEIANHNYSINVINIYNRLANDSFVAMIYQTRYQELMSASLRRLGIRHLRVTHSSEAQIAEMLKDNPTRVKAVSQPTLFIFSKVEQVISDINLLEDSCMVYDINVLSEALDCPPGLLRRCLLGAFLYFQCSPSKRNELRIVSAMKKPFSEFSDTHIQSCKDNMELLERIITTLRDKLASGDSDDKVCTKVADIFDLDREELTNVLIVYKRSSSDSGKFNPDRLDNGESSKWSHALEQPLQFWAVNNYLPQEIVRLFSACSDYTAYFYFPKFECLEIDFMYQIYFRQKIEFAVSHIASTTKQLLADKQATINFFDEEIVKISFVPLSQDALPALAFSDLAQPAVDFYWELRNFFDHVCQKKQNHSRWPDSSSVVQALKFIHLSLLRDLFYINTATQSILVPGAALLEFGENEFQEEIVFMFELIRSNMIQSKMYRDLQATSRENIKIIQRNFFDMLIINDFWFDPFLIKFNFNYIGKSSFAKSNTNNLDSPSFNIEGIKKAEAEDYDDDDNPDSSEKLEEKLSEMKFSINILYKTAKSFKKEYLRFHEDKSEEDAHWILEEAFAERALGKVLFISRMMTFAVTNYVIPEIFDYEQYQFHELYTVVGKSLRLLMTSYLFYFTDRAGLAQQKEFIDAVTSAFPFQKNYSLDFGILLKILLPKFLIYKTLEGSNDAFASVIFGEFDSAKMRAKYAINFDLDEALERGKRLFIKLYAFLQCMEAYGNNAVLSKFSQNLKRSSSMLKDFLAFIQKIPAPTNSVTVIN